jgi:hypothetical protein
MTEPHCPTSQHDFAAAVGTEERAGGFFFRVCKHNASGEFSLCGEHPMVRELMASIVSEKRKAIPKVGDCSSVLK